MTNDARIQSAVTDLKQLKGEYASAQTEEERCDILYYVDMWTDYLTDRGWSATKIREATGPLQCAAQDVPAGDMEQVVACILDTYRSRTMPLKDIVATYGEPNGLSYHATRKIIRERIPNWRDYQR